MAAPKTQRKGEIETEETKSMLNSGMRFKPRENCCSYKPRENKGLDGFAAKKSRMGFGIKILGLSRIQAWRNGLVVLRRSF